MTHSRPYPIGTPGQPWGEAEREQWRRAQPRQRRYHEDVLPRMEALAERFERIEYGQLDYGGETYPLFAFKSRPWDAALPTALITGGVHGYETSGVMGALEFLEGPAADYAGRINRWTYDAIDPNRNFRPEGPVEATALMALIAPLKGQIRLHIDLHETTDSDESEFRPALAARDGKPFEPELIPDGFYVVADAEKPELAFQQAIIAEVEKVTHIAPPDSEGRIIGCPVVSPGVIEYPQAAYAMCPSITGAPYTTTTEVYPDSPRATPEQCNAAQVAAVRAALDYVLAAGKP